MTGTIAPTDSRFREDVQLFENGKEEEADREKVVIEVRQRNHRKLVAEGKMDPYEPKYFRSTPHPRVVNSEILDSQQENPQCWELINDDKGYWSRRNNKDWSDCLDIWGQNKK